MLGLGLLGRGVERACALRGDGGINAEGVTVTELLCPNHVTAIVNDIPMEKANVVSLPKSLQDCSKYKKLVKIDLERRDVYVFDASEIRNVVQEQRFWLIGGVLGGNVSKEMMDSFIALNWNGLDVQAIAKPYGMWCFQFKREKDLRSALDHDTWLVAAKFPLALTRWKEGRSFTWGSFKKVPTWIRLWNLKPMFRSTRMLNVIASMIGDPISIDNSYWAKTKPEFVRMLVSVSAEDVLREAVTLKSKDGIIFTQKVWYEWIPFVCDECKCFGHETKRCRRSVVKNLSEQSLTPVPCPVTENSLPNSSMEKDAGSTDCLAVDVDVTDSVAPVSTTNCGAPILLAEKVVASPLTVFSPIPGVLQSVGSTSGTELCIDGRLQASSSNHVQDDVNVKVLKSGKKIGPGLVNVVKDSKGNVQRKVQSGRNDSITASSLRGKTKKVSHG